MNCASSLARNATSAAISCSSAPRRIGVASRIFSVISDPSAIGELTRPGWIALTRMPQVTNSSAAVLVSPRSAHLLAL